MQPGELVVLDNKFWDDPLGGKIAMVLGAVDTITDEDFSDQMTILTHPTIMGETLYARPHEFRPLEP